MSDRNFFIELAKLDQQTLSGCTQSSCQTQLHYQFSINKIVNATGFSIRLLIWDQNKKLFFEDHSVLAPSSEGQLCSWSLNTNFPGLHQFKLNRMNHQSKNQCLAIYFSGDADNQSIYRQRIKYAFQEKSFNYSYAYAFPGEEFEKLLHIEMMTNHHIEP